MTRNSEMQNTLEAIEAKTERRGLAYVLEHVAKDETFARVIITYNHCADLTALVRIAGYAASNIYGIFEIQIADNSAIVDLQSIGGENARTYENLLLGVLADLLNAGLTLRVDGRLLTFENVNQAVNPKIEHPTKRARKDNVKRLRQEGLTIEEIAEHLGVSDATIKRDLKILRLAVNPK